MSGSVLTATAAPGESNVVSIGVGAGQTLRVADSAPLTAGPGCTLDGAGAYCDSTGLTRYDVTLGDGDDRFEPGPLLEGVVRGGAGADELNGGGARDELHGDEGADTLSGGSGGDALSGGPGDDWLDYSPTSIPRPVSTTGVTVDLDGVADDGMAGEHDNVTADVENILGTFGDDTLTGNAADNVLDPFAGADTLDGGAGEDVLDLRTKTRPFTVDLTRGSASGWFNDVEYVSAKLLGVEDAWGGSGDDTLIGDAAANWLDGGDGADLLVGGPGPDFLDGGNGFDAVSYEERSGTVTADLDGGDGDDGEAGEGDTIGSDVEDLYGGAGADRLTGSDDDNVLYGVAGADVLTGGAGDDYLEGEAGE